MKKKIVWIPLIAALLSMIFLYAIGNIFEIPLLRFHFYMENASDGQQFEAEGSMIPVIIGIIIGFITERRVKHKDNTDSVQ